MTATPPKIPGGPPDGETAVRDVDFVYDGGTGFVRTPVRCPRRRQWVSSFSTTDAAGRTFATTSLTPCRRR